MKIKAIHAPERLFNGVWCAHVEFDHDGILFTDVLRVKSEEAPSFLHLEEKARTLIDARCRIRAADPIDLTPVPETSVATLTPPSKLARLKAWFLGLFRWRK